MPLLTRPARASDAGALTPILNAIIRAGGTTGYEIPFTEAAFCEAFLTGPEVLSAQAVEGATGALLGFQTLSRHPDLPPGWGDIATFTRRDNPVKGSGQALFAASLLAAQALQLTQINATIRADNTGGLRFYRALGFVPYGRTPQVPLLDGRAVDRLHHRFDL